MSVGLNMDVHVPQAITDGLRRRDVDVLTAIEDGMADRKDFDLLDRAAALGRLVFTQDIRFKALAEERQLERITFGGLAFGHQLGATIGQYIDDLELIAKASEPGEWVDVVQHLPFKRET
jgi:hypothetical protein